MPITNRNHSSFINSICCGILSFLFMLSSLTGNAAVKGHKKRSKAVTKPMRAVAISPAGNNEPFFTVTFTESQRFYKLPADANPAYLELLKASAKDHNPVLVKRAGETSDVILSVERVK